MIWRTPEYDFLDFECEEKMGGEEGVIYLRKAGGGWVAAVRTFEHTVNRLLLALLLESSNT